MPSAYHPQTDGTSELTNKIVIQLIRNYFDRHQHGWAALPKVRFDIISATNSSTGFSPFQFHLVALPESCFPSPRRTILPQSPSTLTRCFQISNRPRGRHKIICLQLRSLRLPMLTRVVHPLFRWAIASCSLQKTCAFMHRFD